MEDAARDVKENLDMADTRGGVPEERSSGESGASHGPNEEHLFSDLLRTFQDPTFQQTVSRMTTTSEKHASQAAKEVRNDNLQSYLAEMRDEPPAVGAAASDQASGDGTAQFFTNFIREFDKAAESDPTFAQMMERLMGGMLSSDKELLCEPVQQIVKELETYLSGNEAKAISKEDRARYARQLDIYKQIVAVYDKDVVPVYEKKAELSEEDKTNVQTLLMQLQEHGAPPEEVMMRIAPPEADGSGDGEEHFAEFMSAMGLDQGLEKAEANMLKRLSDDPGELRTIMQELSHELFRTDNEKGEKGGAQPDDQACKQQ